MSIHSFFKKNEKVLKIWFRKNLISFGNKRNYKNFPAASYLPSNTDPFPIVPSLSSRTLILQEKVFTLDLLHFDPLSTSSIHLIEMYQIFTRGERIRVNLLNNKRRVHFPLPFPTGVTVRDYHLPSVLEIGRIKKLK